MCTSIVEVVGAAGAGKGVDGWFDLTRSVVSYDRKRRALLEAAITIDFMNSARPGCAGCGGAYAGCGEGAEPSDRGGGG